MTQKVYDNASLSQKLFGSEVIFSRQATLREIVDYKETDDAGLLDAPFNFEARDLGNSMLYIASFLPEQGSVWGRGLVSVLCGAKPGKVNEYQLIPGILGDWVILREEERRKIEIYQRLYNEHIMHADYPRIKESIKEFEANHFPQFWGALQLDPPSKEEIERKLDEEISRILPTRKALATYGLDFLKESTDGGGFYRESPRLLGLMEWTPFIDPDLRKSFVEFVRNRNFDTHRETPSLENYLIRRIFTITLAKPERDQLITEFYHQLSDKEIHLLTMGAIGKFSPAHHDTVLVDEDTGKIDRYWTRMLNLNKNSEDGSFEIREGDSYVRVAFVPDEQTGYKEPKIVGKHIVGEERSIAPIIIWSRDKTTGKATYYCGKIPEEQIRAFPDIFSERHDTLLGQLVVADYSYDVRLSLPVKLPLKKGGKKNAQMEAQAPVNVKLFSNRYLEKSPVILGLEDLVRQR